MKKIETKNIIAVLKKYKSNSGYKDKIRELGIFGSFASDSSTNKSDIDIFLRLEPARMFDLIDIKEDIEKLLHKKVDIVVIRKSMNPYLKKQIENNGIYV
ncbi:MAG: DNA polymerase beta domain-containing protein [Ignavibacteria bacterium]|nr:MAG: DNA polymerase beta domain-containing protein [Ignavibacteria bacterium]KAF0158530.1 MAG: DNA polymerase beta domain-containing protein [Ignavibacteria bacterium]